MTHFIDGFATESGELLVYLYDRESGELLGKSLAHVSEGCGLAPGQALDAPPRAKKGNVIVRDGDQWQLLEDHRGAVYRTVDGSPAHHQALGPLPDELTTQPRPSVHHRWASGTWQLDADAAANAESERAVTEARGHLTVTDWYVIRKLETGEEIPAQVLACRQDARALISAAGERPHV